MNIFDQKLDTKRNQLWFDASTHVLAQLTRFVVRKQMEPKDAATLASELGLALINEFEIIFNQGEDQPGPAQSK